MLKLFEKTNMTMSYWARHKLPKGERELCDALGLASKPDLKP